MRDPSARSDPRDVTRPVSPPDGSDLEHDPIDPSQSGPLPDRVVVFAPTHGRAEIVARDVGVAPGRLVSVCSRGDLRRLYGLPRGLEYVRAAGVERERWWPDAVTAARACGLVERRSNDQR